MAWTCSSIRWAYLGSGIALGGYHDKLPKVVAHRLRLLVQVTGCRFHLHVQEPLVFGLVRRRLSGVVFRFHALG
jgi:hypothetical protein